ncbi:MAG TPA: universal stress protein [Rhodospirillaceae bacterium]|nr:universal stress protein [Rhodospirillaceae bacterium]
MKDILVHLDSDERCVSRLDIAADLAVRFGARLLGLFAQAESDGPSLVARRMSAHLGAAADQAHHLFETRTAGRGLRTRWMQLSHGEAGHVVAETAFCARYADLTVLGQWHERAHVPAEFAEQVILQSGRPTLVIPQIGWTNGIGRRVAIAWNASRESSRAVHDGLPMLKEAEEVFLLAVREPVTQHTPHDSLPKVEIADHLASHGIAVTAERLATDEIGVMDALLSRAFDLGADLLVMGAHSGIGLSFLRGSGTRFILRHMTLPVMMSN